MVSVRLVSVADFEGDPPVVLAAMAAITEVLGPPEPTSTKKVAKWHDRGGITANLHRESRRAATVWISGGQLAATGELDLLSGKLTPAQPPQHSNCSPAIKTGPTAFAYARDEHDFQRLGDTLRRLQLETPTVDETLVPDAIDESDDDEALVLEPQQKRVLTQSRDESVDALVSRIRKGRLILQPEFQRDFVWSRSKSSLLIESILMQIPLPVIYVAELPDGTWEVVDGQQRLTTIRSFIDGRFPNGETARLGQLRVRSDLRGKTFQDLPPEDQVAIEDYTLRVILIQKEANPDLKFEVFERLNSGADKLNDMELRNCIYRGSYNDMLKELSEHDLLLKIRADTTPDARMQDRQLILRFFAMWRNTHLRYRGPMKQFMNHEMQEHRHATPEKIAEMKRVFSEAMQCAWDVFGAHAFRRYSPGDATTPQGRWETSGKLNVALWDTILYVFSYYERRQILPIADALREEFLDLLTNDATFVDYIGRTTDKPDRIRYRAEAWKRRVDALVSVPQHETRNFSRQLKVDLHKANPACAICSQHIHTPDDAEVDHILHYWRGGRTIPANARLTHRYCNRVRGGREPEAAVAAS